MKIDPNKCLSKFQEKLKQLDNDRSNLSLEEDVIKEYRNIVALITSSYSNYRNYFFQFLSILDAHLSVSIVVFFKEFTNLMSRTDKCELDLLCLDENIPDNSVQLIKSIYSHLFGSKDWCRLSDISTTPIFLSQQQARQAISCLVALLKYDSLEIEWSAEIVKQHTKQLIALRSLLSYIDNLPVFYFSARLFFDRLVTSEYFQLARDLNEEILISSFKDDETALGFLNAFSCYSQQGSIKIAMLFANMSMHCSAHSEKKISDRYVRMIFKEAVKCFRNAEFFTLAIKIYDENSKNLELPVFERRAIDHSYYSCLMLLKQQDLPRRLLDYLHAERESLFCAGVHECLPWLLLLLNVKRLFPDDDYTHTGLGFYIHTFKMIVPEKIYKEKADIIDGATHECKESLKKSIQMLNDTRHRDDIVIDNGTALIIASRMVEDCFLQKDVEGVLLSMIVKSDFSLLFKPKDALDFRSIDLPSTDLKQYESVYCNRDLVASLFCLTDDESVVWIPVSEGKVYQLTVVGQVFTFTSLTSFRWQDFIDLKKSNYFSTLSWTTDVKTDFGIMDIPVEDYIAQEEQIIRDLKSIRFYSDTAAKSMLVIKDLDLANLPHNLMLNEAGDFIHLSKPIANILSSEWYLASKNDSAIKYDYSKSIWIPTKSGDFGINRLHGYILSSLNKYNFDINIDLDAKVSSELNIICSHGDRNIAQNQVVYPGDGSLNNLDEVIGEGKILMFFVCHSGSYKNELFTNDITSLVKKYILAGYKAVVAPFWSLHIDAAEIWFSKFMSSFEEGLTINYAVHKANKAVWHRFPTPCAWACMHLYGNPQLARTAESVDKQELKL